MRYPAFICTLLLSACMQAPEPLPTVIAGVDAHPAATVSSDEAKNIIFQSTDAGDSWKDVGSGLPWASAGSLVGSGNEIYLSANMGLFHGLAGSSWPSWGKPFTSFKYRVADNASLGSYREHALILGHVCSPFA